MIRDEDMDGFLSPLSVGRLGGPRTAKKLAERGIRTAGDLRGTDASLLYSWFWSTQGARLWGLARGVDDSPVVPAREAKSISQEVTYPEDLLREDTVVRELR